MRVQTVALAVTLAMLTGGAVAQNAGGAPPDVQLPQTAPAPSPATGDRSGDMRPGGDMRGGGRPDWHRVGHGPGGFMGQARPSRGAVLKVDRDGGFYLKCGEDEGTKACMEAAAPLIDKVVQARQGAR